MSDIKPIEPPHPRERILQASLELFVDQGYLTEEKLNEDFLRWLYTAITRASKELFLVNFHDRFFTV